jgi:SAM-dependent methyltransferase
VSSRLDPPLWLPTYAVRAPLARWLADEARRAHADLGALRVLDVGCGDKPYFQLFAPYVSAYVGVDPYDVPEADLRGSAEDLPVGDGSQDVVLCVQVLEHAEDPSLAVRELARVTAPGGRVLASTHGVMVYHPSPSTDYWRWTAAGLERLFRENGEWASVRVTGASGTTACLGMIASLYLDLIAQKARVRGLVRPLVAGLNATARAIDGRVASLRDPFQPGGLIANYHVVAERAR